MTPHGLSGILMSDDDIDAVATEIATRRLCLCAHCKENGTYQEGYDEIFGDVQDAYPIIERQVRKRIAEDMRASVDMSPPRDEREIEGALLVRMMADAVETDRG